MDQARGVFQLAAEADRQLRVIFGGRQRGAAHGAGEGEKALAVLGLDDLGEDTARRAEGGVDFPARARSAEARKRKGAAGEALGDISRRVDPQHEERDSARRRPRKGGQPMTHLLEARSKARANEVDVVTARLAGFAKGLVRHHRRRGEIVGEGHFQQSPGRLVRRRGAQHKRDDVVVVFEQGELIGQSETPARGPKALRQ